MSEINDEVKNRTVFDEGIKSILLHNKIKNNGKTFLGTFTRFEDKGGVSRIGYVVGCHVNGKVFNRFDYKSEGLNNSIRYIVQYVVDGKIKLMTLYNLNFIRTILPDTDDLPYIFKVRIKNFEDSSLVFGLKAAKRRLVDSVHSNYDLGFGRSVKLGRDTFYFNIPYKDRMIKFTINDVEFIEADLRSYNPPIDKTIKLGSKVIIRGSINKDKYNVITILPCKSSRRIPGTDNRRNDIVLISDSNGISKEVFAKRLKVI